MKERTLVMSKILIDGKSLPFTKPTTFTTQQFEVKHITDMQSNHAAVFGPQIPNDISIESIANSHNIQILEAAIAKILKGETLEMEIICQNDSSFRFDLNDLKYTIKEDGTLDIKTISLCTRHEII